MKKRMLSVLMAAAMAVGTMAGAAVTVHAEEEPVTVKWLMFGTKAADHDVVMEDLNEKLVEKIGVKLDVEMIADGEYEDKVKLASTAGEDFDLVFTSSWKNKFDENMSREAFLPLDDLIAEYGQDIVASVPEWLLPVGAVDGVQYAIPNQQILAKQYGFAIQKEYADKYGFDKTSLKSMAEIEPFFDEIVKNEPQMFVCNSRNPELWQFYESLVGDLLCADLNDPEGKIYGITDVNADSNKQRNDWYKKGYIRQDIATVTDDTADEKANRYVAKFNVYKPGWAAEETNKLGKEYIEVPIEGAYIGATSGVETMTAINVNSAHPEEAMKVLNLVYTDKEIFNELLFGIEGTHYNKTGEDSIEMINGGEAYNYGTYAWKFGNQFNAYRMPGQVEGVWEATDELNRTAKVSPLRGFTFNTENVQTEIAQLSAVVAEFKNGEYIAEDIDKFNEEYKAKMEAAGLQTLVDEANAQVAAWKEANAQ